MGNVETAKSVIIAALSDRAMTLYDLEQIAGCGPEFYDAMDELAEADVIWYGDYTYHLNVDKGQLPA